MRGAKPGRPTGGIEPTVATPRRQHQRQFRNPAPPLAPCLPSSRARRVVSAVPSGASRREEYPPYGGWRRTRSTNKVSIRAEPGRAEPGRAPAPQLRLLPRSLRPGGHWKVKVKVRRQDRLVRSGRAGQGYAGLPGRIGSSRAALLAPAGRGHVRAPRRRRGRRR